MDKELTKNFLSSQDATGYQYPKGTKYNIIPCSNGKYCCSVDVVSTDCCAVEEDTFEVSFGRVRDSTTTMISTWTYTTTSTETVCPTTTETLASTTPAAVDSTATPNVAARFGA